MEDLENLESEPPKELGELNFQLEKRKVYCGSVQGGVERIVGFSLKPIEGASVTANKFCRAIRDALLYKWVNVIRHEFNEITFIHPAFPLKCSFRTCEFYLFPTLFRLLSAAWKLTISSYLNGFPN